MAAAKIKKGDSVVVLSGKDKGKTGTVAKVMPKDGKVVVNRTRDGGKTFDTLTKGLPQDHAYDLVFRHALDIDESGERLMFGSTTGSLWVTEDSGDSWQTLSSNLPPVYAVRFEKPA